MLSTSAAGVDSRDAAGTFCRYADRLLSLVTLPAGALEPLGAAALRRVRAQLVPRPPPGASSSASTPRSVVLLSRSDMGSKRSLRNEPALLAALEAVARGRSRGEAAADSRLDSRACAPLERGEWRVEVFIGSLRLSLVETQALFARAAVLTGPHGGAFLNMMYVHPGTPVVEIGYTAARPMPYRRRPL